MKYIVQTSPLGLAILFCICVGISSGSDQSEDDCGVIYVDKTEVDKKNYVYEPLRTLEYFSQWERMTSRLRENSRAFSYIHRLSKVEEEDPHPSTGTPVCPSESKKIHGYFKHDGKVLCLVARPDLQNVQEITCTREYCCDNASRCSESGVFTQRFLVFCDFFIPDKDYYFDIIQDDPNLCNTDALIEDQESPDRRRRSSSTTHTGYFAFKFSEFASTCSCGLCYEI
ncbi:uncharacterized protein LOC132546221 [Ylistrum balloti]|uniref:uncharacterized protein LOC132546221 n=1 Tax=Ylistrum balloti TaxID=509963 RepID=UPI002905C6A4|nr:uncharacterized protein LOC132546221 [Ylistrum balloti]